jgi:type IX secretion system PorP/SprF family membrane protein
LALLLAALQEAVAQYDPSFSHYWALETAYNPAAAGKQDKLNIMAAYNMSMVGFEHNQRTIFATADMPFYFAGAYHGVGAQLMNDDIGAFSHKKFSVIYAYKQKLFGGTLSIACSPDS